MPQGIMNALIVFSRIMYRILGDLEFVVVYIDDICIFSETLAEHLNHVKLMQKLYEVNNITRRPPHNVKSLQSFKGGANYYRGNLKGFAIIVSRLYWLKANNGN